jgi:AcrR family transcriptional regulator
MNSKSRNDFREQRILDAAKTVLAQYGYDRATISLIAAKAGVSRGLLHYYFKNKEEMLAKVIKENTKIATRMIAEIFDHHHTPEGYARGIAGWFRNAIENDSYLFLSIYEGVVLVRQSRVLSIEIADSYIKWKQAFEIGLKHAQEKQYITPGIPVKSLAALVSALIDGMGLQFLSEPDLVKDDLIWKTFEACIVDLFGSKQ